MTTSSQTLYNAGRILIGRNFIGVFPSDKIPPLSSIQSNSSMIVNNQTYNLPGQHWLAILIRQHSIIVFDPLGPNFYPHHLVNYLHSDVNRKVHYSLKRIQNPLVNNCGQLCLDWLKGKMVLLFYISVCICVFVCI